IDGDQPSPDSGGLRLTCPSTRFPSRLERSTKTPAIADRGRVCQPTQRRLNGTTLLDRCTARFGARLFAAFHPLRARAAPALELAGLRCLRRFGAFLVHKRLWARLRSLAIVDLSRSTNTSSLVSAITAATPL